MTSRSCCGPGASGTAGFRLPAADAASTVAVIPAIRTRPTRTTRAATVTATPGGPAGTNADMKAYSTRGTLPLQGDLRVATRIADRERDHDGERGEDRPVSERQHHCVTSGAKYSGRGSGPDLFPRRHPGSTAEHRHAGRSPFPAVLPIRYPCRPTLLVRRRPRVLRVQPVRVPPCALSRLVVVLAGADVLDSGVARHAGVEPVSLPVGVARQVILNRAATLGTRGRSHQNSLPIVRTRCRP